MKAIYSHWSKPSMSGFGQSYNLGFANMETFLWSYALSVELAKQQFNQVELVCDSIAKKIVIDQMGIPFTNVETTLDKLQNKNPAIWIYGKLEAYRHSKDPFIHIDNDLFIYKKFEEEFSYPFFFWCLESNLSKSSLYNIGLKYVQKAPFVPELLRDATLSDFGKAANVGIIMVNDMATFNEYLALVYEYLENESNIEYFLNTPDNLTCTPVIIEQYLLLRFLEAKCVKYGYYKDIGFTGVPHNDLKRLCDAGTDNIHFISALKRQNNDLLIKRAVFTIGKKYSEKIKNITDKYKSYPVGAPLDKSIIRSSNAIRNISVIIPAHKGDALTYVLQSLSMQREYIKEIIIVEDWIYEGDFEIEQMSKKYGCSYFRLPLPKSSPFDIRATECRNLGFKYATGDLVLWLDDDSVPCLWFMHRLMEIHNHFPSTYFCANRILLNETPNEVKDRWEYVIGTQWDYQRRIPFDAKNYQYFNGFWDNTKDYPYSAYTHNLSVRRDLAIDVGGFEHFFGYGEEDVYWDYKAEKLGIHGLYQCDMSKDIYIGHLYHDHNLTSEISSINRLWLYSKDPGFREACRYLRGDWNEKTLQKVEKEGLQSLEVFSDLPSLPESLKKYIKAKK
ncbi:MAG: glycosyltransferase family A protein [Methanomassiliicoccales archaeon]|jgi:hypothetical protein